MKRRNFIWYSLLWVAGCSNAISIRSSEPTTPIPDKLRFAVTDAEGLEELQRDYEPFRVALEEVLATKIEFFPVESLVAAAPAMLSGELDLAWAGPSEYVVLHSRAQAIPVVTLQRHNYHTVIVVHANSGIKSLTDLPGKTLDVWQMGAAASHLGAVKILIDAGINPAEVKIIERSNDRSLTSLKTGETDAASRPFSRYLTMLQEEGLSDAEYKVLSQGPPLPGDVFAVAEQLGTQVNQAIGSRMLEHQDQLMQASLSSAELAKRFKGGTLGVANDADYDIIREVYRAIGQEEVIH
jgi:phosphonate transport system substrate-binding protein